MNAEYYIEKLGLTKHPEGGYYKEIYRAAESIEKSALPARYNSARNVSTAIYFLLNKSDKSHFHKLNSDELWHFYDGTSLTIHMITEEVEYTVQRLGRNLEHGEVYQCVIPKGTWFAAEVDDKKSFTLIGCTVAPGFDFADFTLAKRNDLIALFPGHKKLIEQFSL